MIYFRNSLSVRDLHLQKSTTLRTELTQPRASVLLRCFTDDEIAKGHEARNAVCEATVERDISQKIRALFQQLATGIMPDGWQKTEGWQHCVQEDGMPVPNHSIQYRYLPRAMQDILVTVGEDQMIARERVVGVLRWRYDLPGKPNPFGFLHADWSFDKCDWRRLPVQFSGEISTFPAFRPTGSTEQVISQLANTDEPVGHELFREAWENRHSNPRSALLIGIAALEVGFKECVADLVPSAGWLVENAPTPPVVNMLADYLPNLPVRCKPKEAVLPIAKPILDILKKGVLLRNKVTHTGANAPNSKSLREILRTVKLVLWLLDLCRGHEWAFHHFQELKVELQDDKDSFGDD